MERALLCELHAHTTWSDGELSLRELVDLYGATGFDVLCVTDHVLRSDDPWRRPETCVHEANFGSYLAAVDAEAERARAVYGLLAPPRPRHVVAVLVDAQAKYLATLVHQHGLCCGRGGVDSQD